MSEYLDLYDYRLRVAALYRSRNQSLLAGEDAAAVLSRFRQGKDALFAIHSQSAFDKEQQRGFTGLRYFPYNPHMRFIVRLNTEKAPRRQNILMNAEASMTAVTIGNVQFSTEGEHLTLSVYWLDIYGGGLFLPFRDATCAEESYGGGRYLFDTIKGADFITAGEQNQFVLDFNYAYNPSCAYNNRWVCPLAPAENWLPIAIPAGEMRFAEL